MQLSVIVCSTKDVVTLFESAVLFVSQYQNRSIIIIIYMSFKKDVEVANRPDGVVWK